MYLNSIIYLKLLLFSSIQLLNIRTVQATPLYIFKEKIDKIEVIDDKFLYPADTNLDIDLISYSANYEKSNNSVLIQWTVGSQVNNRCFTVEKTTDGSTWIKVGEVEGDGTTSVTINYLLTDNAPVPGVTYYRLQQTDDDGKQTMFSPVAVNIYPDQETIALYPNPVCSVATVHLYLPNKRTIKISISDESGRNINLPVISACMTPGCNLIPLNTALLHAGVYFLVTSDGTESHSIKFLKQ